MMARISGTENYDDEALELVQRYASISFADAHAPVLHLISPAPCRTLDTGEGPDGTRQDLRPWNLTWRDASASVADDRMAR